MADTAVAITAGVGTNIDTRTEATNSNHRQVIVIGDPSVNAGVAPVDVTNGLSVNVTNAVLTTQTSAATTGGLTLSSILIAAGTNATNVKASAGQIYKIEIFNNSATIAYLKIYNTAGTPTAGAGTPVTRIMVPGNTTGSGVVTTTDLGLTLGTGIGFTFTGGIADADTTSVAASTYILNIYYK